MFITERSSFLSQTFSIGKKRRLNDNKHIQFAARVFMKGAATGTVTIQRRLEKAISELRSIHRLLLSGEGIDDRILTDFRDAVNRVRNTAWSAKQYAALKATNQDHASLMSILAIERVRATFQLVQALETDLANKDVKFQPGQLIELQQAMKALSARLDENVGRAK